MLTVPRCGGDKLGKDEKMETRKILTIAVLALCLVVCRAKVGAAAPMGTAFTYQGQLNDGGKPADGVYDFQFRLLDRNDSDSTQLGITLKVDDHNVIDGYLEFKLDFGGTMYDGNDVWLEMGVRDGALSDPCKYTVMYPLHEVTPTPYSLYADYAKTAGGGGGGGIGGSGTANYIAKFTGPNTVGNSTIYEAATGKVGIGTTSPRVKLSLGTDFTDKKLAVWDGVDDFWGFGSPFGRLAVYAQNTEKISVFGNGNVGINTVLPEGTLDVREGSLFVDTSSGSLVLRHPTGSGWAFSTIGGGANLQLAERSAGGSLTQRVAFTQGGNVGIGITNPSHRLHVDGIISAFRTGYAGIVQISDSNSDSWNLYAGVPGLGDFSINEGQAGNVSRLCVKAGGRVGIGTTATIEPYAQLHVVNHQPGLAAVRIQGPAGGGPAWLQLVEGDIPVWDAGNISYGSAEGPAGLSLSNNATDGDILLSPGPPGGKVGINTPTPAYTLDVKGDIRATGSVYYGGTEGNANGTAYNKPDYVFEQGYDVMSTEQVAGYLKKEKHLPWMTSTKAEREENGDVIDMTRMAFETVETAENLQIQLIRLNELLKEQGALIEQQQQKIGALEEKVQGLERRAQHDLGAAKEVQR